MAVYLQAEVLRQVRGIQLDLRTEEKEKQVLHLRENESCLQMAREAGDMILEAWSSSRLASKLTKYAFYPDAVRRFASFYVDSTHPIVGNWLMMFISENLPHTRGRERNTVCHVSSFDTDTEIKFQCEKCQ